MQRFRSILDSEDNTRFKRKTGAPFRTFTILHQVADASAGITLGLRLRMAAKKHDDVARRADGTQVELILFPRRRGESDLYHRVRQAESGANPRHNI